MKIQLSASKLKTLENCSWLYHASYVLKVPQSPNAGALRGTIIHTVLECFLNKRHKKHFNSALKEIITPQVERLIVKKAKIVGINEPEHIDLMKDMICVAVSLDFFCKGCSRIDSEKQFKIETEDYIINGFLDKIAIYEDKIKLIDYKSSKLKFSHDEIDSNLQWLMYSLAIFKEYGKIPDTEFHFLKFKRNPILPFKQCSKSQLVGFELYLENVAKFLNSFNEETAIENLAVNNNEKKWLCGVEGLNKDGTKKFICQYRNPTTYYVVKNKDGKIIKSSFKKEELVTSENEIIEKIEYKGCPAFNDKKNLVRVQDNFGF